MESASNRSALCQVSLPDFFNNVYKEHLGKSLNPGTNRSRVSYSQVR